MFLVGRVDGLEAQETVNKEKPTITIRVNTKSLWKIKIFLWLCKAMIPFLPGEVIYRAGYNFISNNLELEIK